MTCDCPQDTKELRARAYLIAEGMTARRGFTQTVCLYAMTQLCADLEMQWVRFRPRGKPSDPWKGLLVETATGECRVTINEVKHFDTPWASFIDREMGARP